MKRILRPVTFSALSVVASIVALVGTLNCAFAGVHQTVPVTVPGTTWIYRETFEGGKLTQCEIDLPSATNPLELSFVINSRAALLFAIDNEKLSKVVRGVDGGGRDQIQLQINAGDLEIKAWAFLRDDDVLVVPLDKASREEVNAIFSSDILFVQLSSGVLLKLDTPKLSSAAKILGKCRL